MSNLQWKIGDVTVTRVVEHTAVLPINGFFPTATHEQVARHADWLKPWALDDDDNVFLSIHALCVESEGRRIVVDTCIGQRPLPGMYAALSNDGSFLTALTDAGFARETIDRRTADCSAAARADCSCSTSCARSSTCALMPASAPSISTSPTSITCGWSNPR